MKRIIGTTGARQEEDYWNHRDTAGRGLLEPQGHGSKRVILIITTRIQHTEGKDREIGYPQQAHMP